MNEGDGLTCLRLKIEGFVQSVGFRNFAVISARRLALDGWVRNRFDGTVEVLVSGPTKAVESFVGLCMRGPQGARVDHVDFHRDDPPLVKGFHRESSY